MFKIISIFALLIAFSNADNHDKEPCKKKPSKPKKPCGYSPMSYLPKIYLPSFKVDMNLPKLKLNEGKFDVKIERPCGDLPKVDIDVKLPCPEKPEKAGYIKVSADSTKKYESPKVTAVIEAPSFVVECVKSCKEYQKECCMGFGIIFVLIAVLLCHFSAGNKASAASC